MTDKSAFTDDEWKAIEEAPLLITLAMVAVGQHGPISMVKEASASARALAKPGDHGPANELIAQIAHDAESKEARHDAKAHHDKTMDAIVGSALTDLEPAAKALSAKLPADECHEVGAWLVGLARAVASAAKGTSAEEQTTIDTIAATFGVTSA
jgi:hypothetical protein